MSRWPRRSVAHIPRVPGRRRRRQRRGGYRPCLRMQSGNYFYFHSIAMSPRCPQHRSICPHANAPPSLSPPLPVTEREGLPKAARRQRRVSHAFTRRADSSGSDGISRRLCENKRNETYHIFVLLLSISSVQVRCLHQEEGAWQGRPPLLQERRAWLQDPPGGFRGCVPATAETKTGTIELRAGKRCGENKHATNGMYFLGLGTGEGTGRVWTPGLEWTVRAAGWALHARRGSGGRRWGEEGERGNTLIRLANDVGKAPILSVPWKFQLFWVQHNSSHTKATHPLLPPPPSASASHVYVY